MAPLQAYHIERTCEEDVSIDIRDASHWVVLNAGAWSSDDNASCSKLLRYIMEGRANDALTEGLAYAVKQANDDAEWRERAVGFMTMEHEMMHREYIAREEGIAEGEARGREVGIAEGEARGKSETEARYSKLIDILFAENRIDDLKRAADDPSYRQSLFQEFNL